MKKWGTTASVFILCMVLLSACKIEVRDKEKSGTEVSDEINNQQTASEQESIGLLYGDLVKPNGKDYWMFEEDNCILNDDDLAVYTADDTHLINPSGVCVFGNELVITDQDANALYRYDLDCNYLGTVGKQGMAELEFNMPMALDAYNDQLYILDSGNYRVQVLNKNYEYVSEIQLNAQNYSNGGGIYWDLAVKNEGCIYVSTSGANGIETRIAKVDAAGQTDFEEVFFGHLCSYEGEIYAVNTMEYIYVDEITEQFQSGEHNIYKMVGNEMELLGTLPMYCTPLDFIIKDEKVYIILSGKDRIDIFNLKGEELKQLCKVNAAYDFQYNEQGITMSSDGTIYYIDGQNCKLYRIPPID